jgi:hypothetical protein
MGMMPCYGTAVPPRYGRAFLCDGVGVRPYTANVVREENGGGTAVFFVWCGEGTAVESPYSC